jgi:hypothetical protein
MPNWLVVNARLTVFVTPDTVVPQAFWQAVIGEEPETSIVQRAIATRIETGPFAEGKLTLQVQPIRIDWVHEPVGLGDGGATISAWHFSRCRRVAPSAWSPMGSIQLVSIYSTDGIGIRSDILDTRP